MQQFRKICITLALVSMIGSAVSGLALAHDSKGKGKDAERGKGKAYGQMIAPKHKPSDDHQDDHFEKKGSGESRKIEDKNDHDDDLDISALVTKYAPEMAADWAALKSAKDELKKLADDLKRQYKGIKIPKLTKDDATKAAHEAVEQAEEEAEEALEAALEANNAEAVKSALVKWYAAEKAELALKTAAFEALKKALAALPVPTSKPKATHKPSQTSKPAPTARPTSSPVVTATPVPTAAPTAAPTIAPTVEPTTTPAPTVAPTATPEPMVSAVPAATSAPAVSAALARINAAKVIISKWRTAVVKK